MHIKVVRSVALRLSFLCLLRTYCRGASASSSILSGLNKTATTIRKIQKILQRRIVRKKELTLTRLCLLIFVTRISVQTLHVLIVEWYEGLEGFALRGSPTSFFKTAHLLTSTLRMTLCILNADFKLIKRV